MKSNQVSMWDDGWADGVPCNPDGSNYAEFLCGFRCGSMRYVVAGFRNGFAEAYEGSFDDLLAAKRHWEACNAREDGLAYFIEVYMYDKDGYFVASYYLPSSMPL